MSTAARESSFYSARTCKLSKNFSNGNTSCIGKTVSSVRCDHVVCRLYGNFKPYAASLLLQMKSKFSNEEKHRVSTVSSVARSTFGAPTRNKGEKRKSTATEGCLEYKGDVRPVCPKSGATTSLGSIFQPVLSAANKIRQEEYEKLKRRASFFLNTSPK